MSDKKEFSKIEKALYEAFNKGESEAIEEERGIADREITAAEYAREKAQELKPDANKRVGGDDKDPKTVGYSKAISDLFS